MTHGEKVPLENFWIFLAWNIQKWPLQRGWGGGYFPKMPFFPELLFYFSEVPFCFLELPFCFSKGHFYFWKMLYCFPEFPFSFLEVSSFFSLLRFFFQEYFFSNWLYLLFILLRATQRDNICLALVLLPLGTLYWLNYDAFLINLKPLHAE